MIVQRADRLLLQTENKTFAGLNGPLGTWHPVCSTIMSIICILPIGWFRQLDRSSRYGILVVVVSQFNGTSTPKGSYSAKTGDNDCNVNSSMVYWLGHTGQLGVGCGRAVSVRALHGHCDPWCRGYTDGWMVHGWFSRCMYYQEWQTCSLDPRSCNILSCTLVM